MDTTIRFPDNPMPVSLNALKEYDAYPAGTFIAQPKKDGFRRTIWRIEGQWHYNAKHSTGPHARPMPAELVEAFTLVEWPRNLAIDCEWVGPRTAAGKNKLYAFDLLMIDGTWLGSERFDARYIELLHLFDIYEPPTALISVLPVRKNPGLMDYFAEQLQDPESEGLVVRRADSGLIGGLNACADNPKWVKVKMKEVRK